MNIQRLASVNNPALLRTDVVKAAFQNPRFAGEFMLPASERMAAARAAGLGSNSAYNRAISVMRARSSSGRKCSRSSSC